MNLPKPYYEDKARGIVIYNADARDILPHLSKVDLLLTDPPYGVLSESGSAATRRSGGNQNNGICAWDVAPSSAFASELLQNASQAAIWGGCHIELPPTYGYLVWDKQIDGLNFGEVEFCWTTARFAPRVFRYRAVGVDGGKLHPTQKPLALMRWCLGFFPKAETVLDPFMGSGTTLVACKQLGRKCIGIEISPEYCAIAARRLAQDLLFDADELAGLST